MSPAPGALTWASADVTELADLALGDGAGLSAAVRLRPHTAVVPVVEHRSARGRYGLLLDPVGALPFRTSKPRQWVMAEHLTAFPSRAFTLVLDVCPLRGDAETTLFSYAAPGRGTVLALREQRDGGLTLDLADHQVSFGRFLDYAQWQRIAVSWDSATGEARLYQDDGPARVTAEAAGSPLPALTEPVARRNVAAGVRLPTGGTLVVGQYQGGAGRLGEFDLRRGFRGSVAEVDLWADAAGPAGRPAWTGDPCPGAVGRWRFTAGALRILEALDCGSGTAQVGGFGSGELCDVRGYRVLVVLGRRAWASQRLLAVGDAHELQVRPAPLPARGPGPAADSAPPHLYVDGEATRLDPVEPRDLGRPDEPRFRIGPLQDVDWVRLHCDGETHRAFASAERQGDRLPDLTGRGPALRITS
ncbi:hypothetical protein [Streptomyces sp. NBC_00557]|uniref:hypothetical protein n=1 Tax=Streptomyces sp. NBC_00557 TaxID=2975776 RepID=UPI002E8166FA|nr:hypothetical protein [Streptomyces sp. NBC_00557]WUC39488.1 hypothetical protein OG956_37445 [Streptomyces sp. NBC_00557]